MSSAPAAEPQYLELSRPEIVGRYYRHHSFPEPVLYQTYDLECSKCPDGMLLFQAEADGEFGLVARDCRCQFTQEDASPLEEDVTGRVRERERSYDG